MLTLDQSITPIEHLRWSGTVRVYVNSQLSGGGDPGGDRSAHLESERGATRQGFKSLRFRFVAGGYAGPGPGPVPSRRRPSITSPVIGSTVTVSVLSPRK
ncbi:hypothetical protein GCM10023214_40600 [Amycolatopsis dongchuanensis]|uniref:Uncharacterized protein n=1 Tax=Amycolatopsis dongchuanensis TaxID=1070866 RepID=A0ABP9QTH5_9PSEU